MLGITKRKEAGGTAHGIERWCDRVVVCTNDYHFPVLLLATYKKHDCVSPLLTMGRRKSYSFNKRGDTSAIQTPQLLTSLFSKRGAMRFLARIFR